jgi:hypothetical protein
MAPSISNIMVIVDVLTTSCEVLNVDELIPNLFILDHEKNRFSLFKLIQHCKSLLFSHGKGEVNRTGIGFLEP